MRGVTFAEHLRAAMKQQGMTSRKLAKAWHPDKADQYRRYIMRYLSKTNPVEPTPQLRDEIAAALGVDPRMLPLGEGEQAGLMVDLMEAIQRLERLEGIVGHRNKRRAS